MVILAFRMVLIFFSTEFGAVLLNLQSGQIVSDFHEYVRPTQRPILSEYCINLTGITQSLIDAQANFPIVYQKFLLWLEQIRVDYQLHFASPSIRNVTYGADTAFCCWTNWDLSTFLRSDCTRHGIQPKPHLKAWIDTRKMFQVSFFLSNLMNFFFENNLKPTFSHYFKEITPRNV